jgi:hypothetical protein
MLVREKLPLCRDGGQLGVDVGFELPEQQRGLQDRMMRARHLAINGEDERDA